jgi:lysophospholipid acyltransferase (LPLAT)-like uncharacterized protein
MMTAKIRPPTGIVVPQRLPWHRRLAGWFVAMLLRVSIPTWRCRWVDSKDYPITKGPVIFCIWHNRLPLALASWDDFAQAKWPNEGIAAMISASRDGGFLANIVQRFGIEPIRGSSSRRGPQALLEATTLMERNYAIVITPDGPRGPVYKVQDGIIQLAKLTGRPIIPTSNFTKWKVRLRSWDKFQIPLPFARCELRYSEPIWVPRDASDAEIEALRAKLEESMRAITRD